MQHRVVVSTSLLALLAIKQRERACRSSCLEISTTWTQSKKEPRTRLICAMRNSAVVWTVSWRWRCLWIGQPACQHQLVMPNKHIVAMQQPNHHMFSAGSVGFVNSWNSHEKLEVASCIPSRFRCLGIASVPSMEADDPDGCPKGLPHTLSGSHRVSSPFPHTTVRDGSGHGGTVGDGSENGDGSMLRFQQCSEVAAVMAQCFPSKCDLHTVWETETLTGWSCQQPHGGWPPWLLTTGDEELTSYQQPFRGWTKSNPCPRIPVFATISRYQQLSLE